MSETIFIDKNTSFNGSIEAEQVVVEGEINGDITASEKVLIKSGGFVNGAINTGKLLLEEGGKHEGLIRLGDPAKDNDHSESVSQPSISQSNEQKFQDEDIMNGETVKKDQPSRLW